MGYGTGYKYAHDFENQFAAQEFLPEELKGTKLYEPGGNPKEGKYPRFSKSPLEGQVRLLISFPKEGSK